MKLPTKYIILLLCIVFIFLFHFGSVAFFSVYPKHFHIEPVLEINQSYGLQKEIQLSSSKDCTQFLRGFMNRIIDESFIKTLSIYCFQNKTGWKEMHQFLNLTFLRHHLGNVSCERHKPHFLETYKPLVALASFPGSGNTWTREILEQITDVYTGSIYTDSMAFFTGSHLCPTDGRVFIVKTHFADKFVKRPGCKSMEYSRAIYILRNPYDSIIAEFNRDISGKITIGNLTDFKSKKWKRFVKNNAKYWEKLTRFWLTNFDKPVHTLVYELLQRNIVYEIFKLIKFIDMPVPLKSLYCLSTNKFETYHRKDKPDWMTKEQLYKSRLKMIVNESIQSVLITLNKTVDLSSVIKGYLLP